MRFWSPSELRNGVKNWKEITPEPLHKAIEALRRKFAENAWKAGEIMRQGCHPALHRGMADQARTISDGIKELGYSALPTVDEGQAEPTVFTVCFDRCAELLAKEVRRTFSDLFDIASAQSALLSSDPVDWASLQTKVLVADESHRIPLWTKDACDKQPYDPSGNPDEAIHWAKWRAPKWFFMQPFASWPYNRATAWERMNEAESKQLLEEVEDRFNQRLIMALEKAVDETHVRLAKSARSVKLDQRKSKETKAATANPLGLPDGFLSAGDPVDGNPFSTGDPRHKVWQEATLSAEEELCRLNSEFLRAKPTGQEGFAKWMEQNKWASASEDFAAWALALCLGKFNIWAKRGVHVVWSENDLRSYDQWLFNYAQAWLEAQRDSGGLTDGALLDLRSRLAERVEWWKAEARRYLAVQKADLAHAPHENAPTIADTAGSKSTDRRVLVNGYIDEVFRATGKRITRKMIWKSAGYNSRTEFERWERRDAKRPNNAAHDDFMRILNEKPHLK